MRASNRRLSSTQVQLGGVFGLTAVAALADAAHEVRRAPEPFSSVAKVLEVGPVKVENLLFAEATGDSNSFHLRAENPLSVTPVVLKVTENAQIRLNGVEAQAGVAWFPPIAGLFPDGKGRSTTVHWEIHVGDEISGTGSLEVTGVPSQSEWDDWYGGAYPHGSGALSNDHLRMTFDLAGVGEGFTEGTNAIKIKLWGSTYVWRSGWTPQDWLHTPTEKKDYVEVFSSSEQVVIERPFTVWKDPASDEITQSHQAQLTVRLWNRNDARIDYRGNLQEYEDPTVEAVGRDGELGPEEEAMVMSRTHLHMGIHPPARIRVTPDFDPISIDIVHRWWSVQKNRGRVYRRHVRLLPTVLNCVQPGAPEEVPPEVPEVPQGGIPVGGQAPARGATGPGGRIVPGDDPGAQLPVNGSVRVRIVSLKAGKPTIDLDASPDSHDQWTCYECLTSGDQVEFRYEFRDIFGRHYEDLIPLTVPDSLDLDAPDPVEIRRPILLLTEMDQDLDPILSAETRALDLGSAAFGVFRPLAGLDVSDVNGGGNGQTDQAGRFVFLAPQGAVLQVTVTDPGLRYLPLLMPETPALRTNLTQQQIAPGQWRDDRMFLWLTPSFTGGRLHRGSGRIDNHAGELFSRIGAVSNIDPALVTAALWETLEGLALGPAAVRPWGVTPRADLGYVPALFALAPPPGMDNSDPLHQAALNAVIAAGGARLHVALEDGTDHEITLPLEGDAVTSIDPTPLPALLHLRAAPNPFNPVTTLSFELAEPGRVRLQIFQLDGRHVTTLLDGRHGVGPHRVIWRGVDELGSEVASGTYLARLQVAGTTRTQKLILIR